MPASLSCKFTDGQLAYVESLPDDLGLLTAALETLSEDDWARWWPMTWGIAEWSSGVRANHGSDVAFRAELMLLQAQAAPFVSGWSGPEVLELYGPVNGFWQA